MLWRDAFIVSGIVLGSAKNEHSICADWLVGGGLHLPLPATETIALKPALGEIRERWRSKRVKGARIEANQRRYL